MNTKKEYTICDVINATERFKETYQGSWKDKGYTGALFYYLHKVEGLPIDIIAKRTNRSPSGIRRLVRKHRTEALGLVERKTLLTKDQERKLIAKAEALGVPASEVLQGILEEHL